VANAHPTVTQYQNYLANHNRSIAIALSRLGRPAEAIPFYERSMAIREALSAAQPKLPIALSQLVIEAIDLSIFKALEGDSAGGLAIGRRALEWLGRIPKPSATNRYSMARAHALIGAQIAKVAPASTPAPADSASEHLEAAMSLLRRAIAGGFRDLAYIRDDRALDPLRSRPDFQLLMMDLAFPAQPLAKSR
jgi:hypothetical protein